MAGGISTEAVATTTATPEAMSEILRDPALGSLLNTAAREITNAAITYTGEFTGELKDSMEVHVTTDDEGAIVARLGSGAVSGDAVAQAAFNWYWRDTDWFGEDIAVDPDYPEWQPHAGTTLEPTRPYEHALAEFHIPYTINPDYREAVTKPDNNGPAGGSE